MTPVPASGLLPNPGITVKSIARPNPLRLPTIDAWNLSLQRSITPTLSVTMAYVGNKGTHTLSSGDGNNTNPNESAIFLPAQYSINGQTLHYTTQAAEGSAVPDALGIYPDNGTNNSYAAAALLRRQAGCLPAIPTTFSRMQSQGFLREPAVGVTGIQYNGNDQNTHFNALQVSVAKQFTKGLTFNANYAWQRSMNDASGYATWNKQAGEGRDDFQREQQIVAYGSYELPFGRNKQFGSNVSGWANQIIGGWQISPVVTYASGLPFTLTYQECSTAIPGNGPPCYPNGRGNNLKLHIAEAEHDEP